LIRALPNILTLARIFAAPLIVALLYLPGSEGQLDALILFILASVTDFFDGWLARKLHAQSRFGAMLDPIADKLLVVAVLVMLVARGTVEGLGVVAVLIIIGREIFVSGLREFLGSESVLLPVSALAKWKTALQLAAIIALLAFGADDGTLGLAAHALLWLAALLSLWTGARYSLAAMEHTP
jgi:CDP-diacylglycerol--glycerol-3-phosphate 3-phosphatidyltransferase